MVTITTEPDKAVTCITPKKQSQLVNHTGGGGGGNPTDGDAPNILVYKKVTNLIQLTKKFFKYLNECSLLKYSSVFFYFYYIRL